MDAPSSVEPGPGQRQVHYLLQLSDLAKTFGGLAALDSVSFDVRAHEITSVIGPNGAGKTTLFNIISGVLRPDRGRVRFDDIEITGWPPHRITKLGIGRTFQNARLFPNLNVLENVAAARYARTKAGVIDALFLRDRSERRRMFEVADEALASVGLSDKRLLMPAELPYGDQRRLEIARAIATEPKLVILDEPTAGMVEHEAGFFMNLMHKLIGSNITLLLIEHNMNVVMSVSQKVIVLNFGKKIAEGTPAEVRRHPEVIDAYLGRDD